MYSWRMPLTLCLAVAVGGCGAPKRRLATPPIDVSPRLAQADALIQAGCFDCLRDALAKYQAIRDVAGAPPAAVDAATAGVVRAAALLALRERELGFVDDGYLKIAKDLQAGRACDAALQPCQPVSQILDIIDLLPTRSAIARGPSSDAQLEKLQQFYRNRQTWLSLLRDAAGQDGLTAYAWLSFICGTPEGRAMPQDTMLAPVGTMRDTPLLMFKRASCFETQHAQLEELLTRDSRFVEVTFLLGQDAIGQRQPKLDEADKWFEQAYAWHPKWPAITMSIGDVALTAEEFDRSLEFYSKTLALEPQAAPALLGKARALTYLKRHEQAIATTDEILAGRYYVGDARYWRALNETELGRIEEAWVDIEEADKLLINDQVPKLAGIIAYRRKQLDVARAKFETARQRNPGDCETSFYLGTVFADQRAWNQTADTFVAAARCLENQELELERDIEQIRTSTAPPARQARQIARREQQIATGRRMLATSSFNTAVAYYSLSRKDEARQFAGKVADDKEFGERAREILTRLR
jgi:tetratricopeptide (TPR) repeat protein